MLMSTGVNRSRRIYFFASVSTVLYNLTQALAVNGDRRVSPGPVEVGDFLFWLVIFFGLVLSSKLMIELSGIL